MGEAKQKKIAAAEGPAWAKQLGLAIGNWFIILTVVAWGGVLILGAFIHQFFDGQYSKQRAIDTMMGRRRFME